MTTGSAFLNGQTGVTLSASFEGVSGTVSEVGFVYGTAQNILNNKVYADDGYVVGPAGEYTAKLNGLQSGTYYYKAWMQVGGKDVFGDVGTFMISASSMTDTPVGQKWLELPALPAAGANGLLETKYATLSGHTEKVRNYSYYYDYEHFATLWVAYPLSPEYMEGGSSYSKWQFNPSIASSKQIDVRSSSYGSVYGAPQYSRGHLLPSASRGSQSMREQIYYVSNQSPQIQEGFNGSVWSGLENAIRAQATLDEIYVVTGVAFEKKGATEQFAPSPATLTSASASPSTLPVPPYFWKVVLKVKRLGYEVTSARAVGFWFANEAQSSSSYANTAVSVDDIESWTGMDFFVNLPDSVEATAEANSSWNSFTGF